jgi:hypothetical protein
MSSISVSAMEEVMDRFHGSTGGCRGITEQFGHSCTDLRGTWYQDSEESGPTL